MSAVVPTNATAEHLDITFDASTNDDRLVREEDFTKGCVLLRACASGNVDAVHSIINANPQFALFKDYDSRTALHVAASEGHLDLVQYLLDHDASPTASDRWGGSPLDDAMRHRHGKVAALLRTRGARLGSSTHAATFITAASRGDFAEVNALILDGADVNGCDYDRRTPLHLASSEGQIAIIAALLAAGANVNAEDRWGGRPMDDARRKGHRNCEDFLIAAGGTLSDLDSGARTPHPVEGAEMHDPLAVEWTDVERIEKIGSGVRCQPHLYGPLGSCVICTRPVAAVMSEDRISPSQAFGDIWKCRWRGTLVAAKMLKSKEGSKHAGVAWIAATAPTAGSGAAGTMNARAIERAMALADLKLEIGLLCQLRHPNICLLLAYSLADDREVMISELMRSSLLDVLKMARVGGTAMSKARAFRYAIQFAQGMNYLHTCKPPVVHRDLKPANLLLDFSDTLKVADFGLAKLRPIDTDSMEESEFMTGETGSYRFMAPEVFRHENYDERVDIYSFSMILYYMLDGEPPWPEKSGVEAAKAAAMKQSRPPLPRHWDVKLSQMMRACWANDRFARPSFAAVLEVLAEVFKQTVGSSYEESLKSNTPNSASGCCNLM
mmetsp:Transcript_41664/g.83579  ORF Transcript_41664/g.83579 Transcript_41664/m.83579 type:complete len:610 (-) Transcript_41664:666-2495(-)|eukprot:CAMPEP_0174695548 /NCGR_PEP_ID=MMETSP1094-20130205/1900_1 /TAXON_ID=156173 /ORGANISM="Chrysochromulina brevifilum, Strain UTEX LB 985" /LENGTH=609 /DNA_ID=CAMNT_0015892077 /DNA_START=86 /DNA_END=1915 /DNA_ORIENTATION=+